MFYLFLKAALTGVLVVSISEVAKKSSLLAAMLASLPLTSILAMIWLYLESRSTDSIATLSFGIFWMVLPSLLFFLLLPVFLRVGFGFPISLLASCLSMSLVYWIYLLALKKAGISV